MATTVTTHAPFAVLAIKSSGVRVLFGRYASKKEADDTVAALRRYALRAEVSEHAPADALPGTRVA